MYLMGLDVGTTGAKAVVFDENGIQKGYGFQEYGITYTKEGYAQQEPENIWQIAKQVMLEAAKESGQSIAAVSLSVQGDAVLPIDRNRTAIGPAQLGMDYRGTVETRWCEEEIGGDKLFSVTGMRPHPMNSIIKVLWVKNHQSELYEKTWKFVTWSDYILAKLGSDEVVIDYTQASRTMAFDLHKKCWSEEILGKLGIDREKLSIPVASGTQVGKINAQLAEELHINPSAVLVTGGHDQTCASLGSGVINEKLALDSHGTAEVISTLMEVPKLTEGMYKNYYPCYCSLLPDRYFTFSLNHTAGLLLKWFSESFCIYDYQEAEKNQESIYSYLFEHMPEGPSEVMVLPYMNGTGTPTCDVSQKGAFLGLTMNTNRFDVAKAIVEALSFESRLNMECLEKNGITVSELRCVGGGARSPKGLQNKADILGMPVSSLATREAACLGAALTAGLSIKMYHSPEEAVRVVTVKDTYEPDMGKYKLYTERFMLYKEMYPLFSSMNKRL
ncbi:FGGY family carbohydrate kinase [Blautia schinkii]|nr:FGGY family carbohydrate kinase [Blautia schinkii]